MSNDIRKPVIANLLNKQVAAFRAILETPANGIPVIVYIILFTAIFVNRREIFNVYAFGIFTPVANTVICIALCIIGIIGFFCVNAFVSLPYRFRNIEADFQRVGFTNAQGEAPKLVFCSYEDSNRRVRRLVFDANGVPLVIWQDRQAYIELALNVSIIRIRSSNRKNRVEVFAVDGDICLPTLIPWRDDYISPKNFEIVLGEGLAGQVVINLAKVPGILIAGATGSGKTILFSSILYQAFEKGAKIALADLKGGVDFSVSWHEKCRFCTEKAELLEILLELEEIQKQRKQLFVQIGARNIDDYNKKTGENMSRYILACDEIAEVLQKTGLDKEGKELVYKLQKEITRIARTGRAFGIHLVLATQRPSAEWLDGDIRSNLENKICGSADDTLSYVVFGDHRASDLIQPGECGRFVTEKGELFQAYWMDENQM